MFPQTKEVAKATILQNKVLHSYEKDLDVYPHHNGGKYLEIHTEQAV